MEEYSEAGAYPPYPHYLDRASIIEKHFSNFDAHLKKIQSYLEGKTVRVVETEDGLQVEDIAQGKPPMNQDGVWGIMKEITSRVDKSYITTRLTENQINQIMREIMGVIAYKIAVNRKEWDIDPADKTSIFHVVEHNVFVILQHAYEGAVQEGIFGGIAQNTRQTVENEHIPNSIQSFIGR